MNSSDKPPGLEGEGVASLVDLESEVEALEPSQLLFMGDELNWVDPDVVAYGETTGSTPAFDKENELQFKEFYEVEWQKPEYDDLHKKWDPIVYSNEPMTRVLAKSALWSVIKLRKLREQSQTSIRNEVA